MRLWRHLFEDAKLPNVVAPIQVTVNTPDQFGYIPYERQPKPIIYPLTFDFAEYYFTDRRNHRA